MCCTRLAEIQDSKNRHFGTIAQLCRAVSSQLRHVSTIGKKVLNINISPTCPHNTARFGLLKAEICWRVWGTPANFNGFRVLAALLHGAGWASAKLCGVEQRAPPIFGRATITLGTGPHSSFFSVGAIHPLISPFISHYLWPPCTAGCGHIYIFSCCGFFFFISSPNLSGRTLDWMSSILPHMVWPWCEFRMHV